MKVPQHVLIDLTDIDYSKVKASFSGFPFTCMAFNMDNVARKDPELAAKLYQIEREVEALDTRRHNALPKIIR